MKSYLKILVFLTYTFSKCDTDDGDGGEEELLGHGGILEPGVQLLANLALDHEGRSLPANDGFSVPL